jgi:gliding motility-associated-like protein
MNRFFKALSVIIIVISNLTVHAQLNTMTYPDTVCILQDVNLSTTTKNAASYYWGTCSAWLERQPKGHIIASNAPLQGPTPITLLQDSGKHYLFTVNYDAPYNLIRYDIGTSLTNLPTPVNLGNFNNDIPLKCTGIDIVNDRGVWIGYCIGGIGVGTQLTRLEFGTSLENTPIVTNLLNLSGLLISPQDIHLFQASGLWYGYYLNGLSGNLERLDFGLALTNTPNVTDLGNPGGLAFPTAIHFVKQLGSYYGFVVNRLSSSMSRLDFGTSMLNTPSVVNLGNFGNIFNSPRDIHISTDDQKFYGYVTNEATNELILLKFGSNISNIPTASSLGNFGTFNGPRGVTRLIREKDNVYGYVTNYQTNTISQIHYDSSTYATILKDSSSQIPTYQYTKPGLYNVYFTTVDSNGKLNEEQHRIQVLAKPKIDLTNDTLICQNDTLFMIANGPRLSKILWEPTYNLIYQNDTNSVYVFPEEDYTYHINMQYEYGCIVDTMINIKVSKIKADAGLDRYVGDGATTILGGPRMSEGYQFKYEWLPNLYINNNVNDIPFPTVRVLDSLQFYYVKVANADGCIRYDTVVVNTFCGDINCPNAFNPTSIDIQNRTFGIANYQLKKLDFFRIFNRFGNMVFETTNPRATWDGNFKGNPQELGTYIWVAEGICNNGRKVKKNGNVLLVR